MIFGGYEFWPSLRLACHAEGHVGGVLCAARRPSCRSSVFNHGPHTTPKPPLPTSRASRKAHRYRPTLLCRRRTTAPHAIYADQNCLRLPCGAAQTTPKARFYHRIALTLTPQVINSGSMRCHPEAGRRQCLTQLPASRARC